MKDTIKLFAIFQQYANTEVQFALQSQLVDTGLIPRFRLIDAFRATLLPEKQDPVILAFIYTKMRELFPKIGFPAPEEFFDKEELNGRYLLGKQENFAELPITFKDVVKLSNKEEYLSMLSYEQLLIMNQNHLVQIKPDMQRETVILQVGGASVPCIKFDEEKAREIKESILQNKQYVTTVRFHLLPEPTDFNGSFVYNADSKELTIKEGSMVNIDGNHRINAILDAMHDNPSIAGYVVVLFTIGSAQVARDIIVQEEKRTPMEEEHVKSLRTIAANDIVDSLRNDDDFAQYWQFSLTEDEFRGGQGVLLTNVFADALMKEFGIKPKETPRNKQKWTSFILDLMCEYADCVDSNLVNYYSQYTQHLGNLMTKPQFVYGLFYIGNKIKDRDDWNVILKETVNEINYNEKPRGGWAHFDDICRNRFREAYDKVMEARKQESDNGVV